MTVDKDWIPYCLPVLEMCIGHTGKVGGGRCGDGNGKSLRPWTELKGGHTCGCGKCDLTLCLHPSPISETRVPVCLKKANKKDFTDKTVCKQS